MKFYIDTKKNISPSQIGSWFTDKSQFISNYFAKEKPSEYVQENFLDPGTRIHRLIEVGILKTKLQFEKKEDDINILLPQEFKGLEMRLIPDSWEIEDGVLKFVDYKTGSRWTDERAKEDKKQMANAWALWINALQNDITVESIEGSIEWVELDTDKTPTGHTEVFTVQYGLDEIQAFTGYVLQMIEEVNAEYDQWLENTKDLSDKILSDVREVVLLTQQKKEIEEALSEARTRLQEDMEVDGKTKVDYGSMKAYYSEKKSYEYPEEFKQLEKDFKAKKKEVEKTLTPNVTKIFNVRT